MCSQEGSARMSVSPTSRKTARSGLEGGDIGLSVANGADGAIGLGGVGSRAAEDLVDLGAVGDPRRMPAQPSYVIGIMARQMAQEDAARVDLLHLGVP